MCVSGKAAMWVKLVSMMSALPPVSVGHKKRRTPMFLQALGWKFATVLCDLYLLCFLSFSTRFISSQLYQFQPYCRFRRQKWSRHTLHHA